MTQASSLSNLYMLLLTAHIVIVCATYTNESFFSKHRAYTMYLYKQIDLDKIYFTSNYLGNETL